MEKHSRLAVPLASLIPVLFACLLLNPLGVAHAANFDVATDGELRNAISSAAASDTITFTADITLADSLPLINKDITIVGNSHVVDGANAHRIFFIETGTVAIENVTIQNGLAKGGDGGSGNGGGGGGDR